jgi:hypothetical protein
VPDGFTARCVYMPVMDIVALVVCLPVLVLLDTHVRVSVCSVAMNTIVWRWVC